MTVPVRPRLDSAKDIEQHFFRHLHNPHLLKHNPLASRLFERTATKGRPEADHRIAGEIRDAVLEGARLLLADPMLASDRAQRLHQIISRCDVAGVRHTIVAADLGLCDRQFYRDRAEAIRRVMKHVRLWLERRTIGDARVVDVFSLELNRADSFKHSASFDTAAAQIARLTNTAPAGTRRALALSRSAELSAELCAFDAAHGSIKEAFEHIRTDNHSTDADRQEALAAAFLSSAVVAEAEGRVSKIDALSARVRDHARAALSFGSRDTIYTMQARAALLQATQSDRKGDVKSGVRHLADAREYLETAERAPKATAAEYFRRSLHHHVTHGSAHAAVADAHLRAVELVQQNGLLLEASRVISTYAAYLSMHGQIEEARGRLAECLSLRTPEETQTYADLLLAAADVECSPNGDPLSAIEFAERVRPRLMPGTSNWANSYLLESMARLKRKDYSGVTAPVSFAIEAFQNLAMDRHAGTGRRILAQACHALGRTCEAKTLIGEAIDQMRGRANKHQLYLAYSASATITGSRVHAQEARRLIANIKKTPFVMVSLSNHPELVEGRARSACNSIG